MLGNGLPMGPMPPTLQAALQSNMMAGSLGGNMMVPTKEGKGRAGEDHRLVIEGVRLAMEIIESKLPNHMGYAHLLLTKTLGLLAEAAGRCSRKEVGELLEREMREVEAEREMINSKMFAYELKGLEDWKKYLRGKFFEEESTILAWFKMVTFLNGSYGSYNLAQTSPAEVVKQILY